MGRAISRIAHSADPLFQTRFRPVTWTVALTDPASGKPIDLTGARVSASLRW